MTHRWWSRHLAVFVRAALRTSAHSVRSAVSATGLGGVVGNKGGLAISFHLGTTSLAFVSCHLAAHDHKNRERNEMCKEILSETARCSRDAAEMQPRRSRDAAEMQPRRSRDAAEMQPREGPARDGVLHTRLTGLVSGEGVLHAGARPDLRAHRPEREGQVDAAARARIAAGGRHPARADGALRLAEVLIKNLITN